MKKPQLECWASQQSVTPIHWKKGKTTRITVGLTMLQEKRPRVKTNNPTSWPDNTCKKITTATFKKLQKASKKLLYGSLTMLHTNMIHSPCTSGITVTHTGSSRTTMGFQHTIWSVTSDPDLCAKKTVCASWVIYWLNTTWRGEIVSIDQQVSYIICP